MKGPSLHPLFFLFCLALALPLGSEPTVLFDAENPPFMYARNGAASGIYPALVSEAFRRMDSTVTLRAIPWKRALLAIASGDAGIGGVYRTPSREFAWDFSDAIYEETAMLYVLRGGDFKFDGLADLRGKKIGVIRGWSYGHAFDSAVHDGLVMVEEENSDILNFRMLAAGRLDAVLALKESGDRYSEFMNAGIHRLSGTVTSNRTYVAFSKESGMASVLASFNFALASMKRDGTFDRIVRTELAR